MIFICLFILTSFSENLKQRNSSQPEVTMSIKPTLWSRPLKLNDNEILYASKRSYTTPCHYLPLLHVINLEKEEVRELRGYPLGCEILDCNLAYDAKNKMLYLLEYKHGAPENLYKIDLKNEEEDWQLIYEGLQTHTRIVPTPNSDSCGLFIRDNTCFLISPSGVSDIYTFNVYRFDQEQKDKLEFVKPIKGKYYPLKEVHDSLIIPKSNKNSKTEFLILGKSLFMNSVKLISLNDGTIKETLNEQRVPDDRLRGYLFEFDATNGAHPIRGDMILIFNKVSDKGDEFIDIIDVKSSMNIRPSYVSCPCEGQYDAVIVEDEEKEKKLIHHWIRNETEITSSPSLPHYLCDIVTSYYCNDKIILIPKIPLRLAFFLWTEIPIDHVLDQDQERAAARKYKWTHGSICWR